MLQLENWLVVHLFNFSTTRKSYLKNKDGSFLEQKILYRISLKQSLRCVENYPKNRITFWLIYYAPPVIVVMQVFSLDCLFMNNCWQKVEKNWKMITVLNSFEDQASCTDEHYLLIILLFSIELAQTELEGESSNQRPILTYWSRKTYQKYWWGYSFSLGKGLKRFPFHK